MAQNMTAAPPSTIGRPYESRINKTALDTKDVGNLLRAHTVIIQNVCKLSSCLNTLSALSLEGSG
jgi:hypothetical protein